MGSVADDAERMVLMVRFWIIVAAIITAPFWIIVIAMIVGIWGAVLGLWEHDCFVNMLQQFGPWLKGWF